MGVEFWSPAPEEVHCTLPPLPEGMADLTVSSVSGKVVSCYLGSCYLFTGAAWGTLAHTVEQRWWHTASVIGERLLLAGGYWIPSATSTELLPVDGGESELSFSLHPGRYHHCAIQPSPTTIILTGGMDTPTLVTEYSGPVEEVTTRELPSLQQGRWDHACGVYDKTLIVAGGYYSGPLRSVELYDYSLGAEGHWRETTPLPSPRSDLRGSMVGGVFHVTGGYDNDAKYVEDILSWDPVTESWAQAGKMAVARGYHAITEVPVASVAEFCIQSP